MEFSTKGQLNDGDWKMVTLEKRRRRYTLRVSGVPVAKKRGPQTLRPGSALYIGGLPQEGVDTLSVRRLPGQKKLELLQTEGFKGCMKQLEVRGRVIDLPSRRNIIHRVGQCMARVELGTFFAGDAFATYDDSFQLGSIVELAVDFRTTELSGVLISVAGPPGGPALSLEITDGQVVFSVHNGGSEPIRARQKFPTKFTVCDNRWHSVKANYVRYQATLKVDRYPERYGFSANGPSQTPSGGFPLYIGGLPERASNSILLQPDNFKGCIRNIEINGVRRDWTDMAQLTNVLLNSCPVEV
ncbi:laminin subunit alpha-1-like [Pollicipes pollicipes]|nr:laminin subunit alpha-1-like [Pollicipes pollicipes]